MPAASPTTRRDVLARIQALRLYGEDTGRLPSSSSSLSRAKRRSGAPNLAPFVRANAELLAADAYLWEGSMKDEVRATH